MKKVWAFGLLVLTSQLAFGGSAQFKYECEVWNSDLRGTMDQIRLTVDSDGSFVLYEDAVNNCNGKRDLDRPGYRYHTDCEWEGFLDVIIDRNMVDGAELGMAHLKVDGQSKHHGVLFCSRQSSGLD